MWSSVNVCLIISIGIYIIVIKQELACKSVSQCFHPHIFLKNKLIDIRDRSFVENFINANINLVFSALVVDDGSKAVRTQCRVFALIFLNALLVLAEICNRRSEGFRRSWSACSYRPYGIVVMIVVVASSSIWVAVLALTLLLFLLPQIG